MFYCCYYWLIFVVVKSGIITSSSSRTHPLWILVSMLIHLSQPTLQWLSSWRFLKHWVELSSFKGFQPVGSRQRSCSHQITGSSTDTLELDSRVCPICPMHITASCGPSALQNISNLPLPGLYSTQVNTLVAPQCVSHHVPGSQWWRD